MNLSRSGLYYRPRIKDRSKLLEEIARIVIQFPGYGYRRITRELGRRGLHINHKVVLGLMRRNGLLAKKRKRYDVYVTSSKHPCPIYPNLKKSYVPDGIDKLWVADITYLHLNRGFAYLAVILDAYSRKVVGFSLSQEPNKTLAIEALDQALKIRRPGSGCIHHSDRGSQYTSFEYLRRLKEAGFLISMSAKGNPYDNAIAESFMKTVKYEEVYLSEYQSLGEAKVRLKHFIGEVYNSKRLHSSIGYLPPDEFEAKIIQPPQKGVQ